MKTVSLKLPEGLLAQIENVAKRRRVSKSVLIRESIEQALMKAASEPVSCYSLARDLAGSVKGLPKDIAHNRKYMRDFGK